MKTTHEIYLSIKIISEKWFKGAQNLFNVFWGNVAEIVALLKGVRA
jgi:hypothetical protein